MSAAPRQLVAVPLALAALISVAPSAYAAARPSVRLSSLAPEEAGQPSPFAWSAKHVPHGGRVVIQQQVGTGKVWRSLRSLHGHGGHGRLIVTPLGHYPLRIAVLSAHRKLLAHKQRTLHAFGPVPLGAVLQADEQTVTLTSSTFSYVALGHTNGDTQTPVQVAGADNQCRSAQIRSVAQADAIGVDPLTEPTSGASTQVLQESAAPVGSPQQANAVLSLQTPLVPGQSWGVTVGSSDLDHSVDFYLDGTLDCDAGPDNAGMGRVGVTVSAAHSGATDGFVEGRATPGVTG